MIHQFRGSIAGILGAFANSARTMDETAPVPFGGALVYVPAEWVKSAEGGVERLMNVYVSMGVTRPVSRPALVDVSPAKAGKAPKAT